MKPDVRERKIGLFVAQVAFSALVPLIVVVFVAALTGSSALARLPVAARKAATPTPGRRIAFAGKRDGQASFDIYTMDPDGSNATRLTTDPGLDIQPSWSPDGSKIAFVSTRNGVASGIYVMNADGSNQHSIYTSSLGIEPAWSPDGSKIAFVTIVSNRDTSALEIYTINPDGSDITPLTTDATNSEVPSWSPDSTKIVFINLNRDGDADYEIYVMNSDGSGQQVLNNPDPGNSDWTPSWSPDGAKIAFTEYESGLYKLYTMNADGSDITPLTPSEVLDQFPTWSPDSQKIAFERNLTGGNAEIDVIDADGGNQHSISGSATQDIYPSWQPKQVPVVLVQNERGTPVAGAEVYSNTQGAGYPSTLIGTTDENGTIPLPDPVQNQYLIARSLIYTGTTSKASHDGWAYHVYLTNINELSNGNQDADIVTDTSKITQTVTLKRTDSLIGFNIVASVEYNATPDNLSTIAAGLSGQHGANDFYFPGASDFLLDVTDGQMFFEKVTVYEDKQHWDDADYQFFASKPRADADLRTYNRNSLTGVCCHIHVQGSDDFGTPWNQIRAYSTLIHEFTHYAMGASDEYYYIQDGDTSTCTLDRDSVPYDLRSSIMAQNRDASEYCTDNHNSQTNQGYINHTSVWGTVEGYWLDNLDRWRIETPNERGFIDPGPNLFISHEADEAIPAIVPVSAPSCAPVPVTFTLNGSPVISASVSLTHNGYSINEGVTDTSGKVLVYGAVTGQDTVAARSSGFPGILYSGSSGISSCGAITVPMSIFLANADRPDTQWPTYWLTATANYSQTRVHALLHFSGDTPSTPTLYASQGGTARQQITLTYDPAGRNYSGDYTFDPNRSTDFQFEVGLSSAQGVQLFPYTFDAAQYHTSGPGSPGSPNAPGPASSSAGVPATPSTTPAPSIWDLFKPENMVSLSVSNTSMLDGTGVMGGQVDAPAEPPNGLLEVGGPYSVQGDNPIVGTVNMSLEFQSEYFCGLQPDTTRIYRYNGTSWDALSTSIDQDWHLAAANISQWGIYAVFAQPNPQAVFSDVPSGSTFHDYINWITCHGIASGYSDATFRPNNNATRGQISKMVALAFSWHLDPPSTGGYTFADVPVGSTFFLYIEAAYREGVVSGYPCGGSGEPCDSQHRPYFRPGNNVTRGQISKIIANGSRFTDTVTAQTFTDVPSGSTFYDYIERMASRNIIGGYPCGGPGEPCDSQHRPYFRPNNNATRGQLSKMIYLALQPR